MSYTVYKHITPSGKVYIGITSQKPECRWRLGEGYKSQILFYRAIQKYGWDNIQHEILYTGLTKEEACAKEIELIAQYKSTNPEYGYNLSTGGEFGTTGFHQSDETKLKIKNMIQGERNPMYGKHHSEISKIKMREAKIGKTLSEEHRRKLSESRKGKRYDIHHLTGSEHGKARKVVQLTKENDYVNTFNCIVDAESKLNLPKGAGCNITSCCRGKLKSAYGYKWVYLEANL